MLNNFKFQPIVLTTKSQFKLKRFVLRSVFIISQQGVGLIWGHTLKIGAQLPY